MNRSGNEQMERADAERQAEESRRRVAALEGRIAHLGRLDDAGHFSMIGPDARDSLDKARALLEPSEPAQEPTPGVTMGDTTGISRNWQYDKPAAQDADEGAGS